MIDVRVAAAKKATERKKPRISINKLSEYLVAPAARRRKLLNDQKYPHTFIVNTYDDAQEAAVAFFAKDRNEEILLTKIDELVNRKPANDKEANDAKLCITALKLLAKAATGITLPADFVLKAGPNSAQRLNIAKVEVSVRPEIIIRGTYRKQKFVGAIKLYIGKTNPLTEDSGEYVSTVLHQYLEEIVAKDDEKVDPKYCFVIDIFREKIYTAPRSHKQRRKDVVAACEEIAVRWEGI
jgi:hypothetical protein